MTKKNGNGNGNLARLEQSERAGKVNLAEWRASRFKELELPSGLKVTIRDMSLMDFLILGKLPQQMVDILFSKTDGGKPDIDIKAFFENIDDYNKMLITMVETCLVEPKIGTEADDEHITLDELKYEDKEAIFNFLNRGASELRPFREGEDEPDSVV